MAKDEAFGIVPILQQNGEYQFLLIQHHAGHWGFPKGHADPGESALETACREFVEETGIADYTVLENISFSEQYTFVRDDQSFEKTVVYYPAFVRSALVRCQQEEVQNYVWLAHEAAISQITFAGAKRVLTEVHQYLASRDNRS
jgi:8-oxo-dGTP pyrophosphatase MutT (NUDIX family)